MVRTLQRIAPENAMERAVGGNYVGVGAIQAGLVREHLSGSYVIDVGCGSGRTAFALRDQPISYHGTDVVPELLAHARTMAERPDWRFTLVDDLAIPDADGIADLVVMFSLITHLTEREAERAVGEAARVLKPGGKIIVSFLDKTLKIHRKAAGGAVSQMVNRLRRRSVMNVVIDRAQIAAWAADLQLVPAFSGPERLGQSYAVLTKPIR
jgi:ubiquinone/menaquinone biosynthesis C-methylase UbiE